MVVPLAVVPGHQGIDAHAGADSDGGDDQLDRVDDGEGGEAVTGELAHKIAVQDVVHEICIRDRFQFFQDFHDKRRIVAYGRVLANGFKYVEDQILEKQDLDADYDLLTGASFSMKNMIGLKNDVSAQRKDSNHKKQRYYGYTEDYG